MADETNLSTLSEEALVSYGSMEGWSEPAVSAGRAEPRKVEKRAAPWRGYALAAAVAAAAYLLHYLPFPPFRVAGEFGVRRPLSAAILALLAGVAARNLASLPASAVEASKHLVKKLIPITIVLTGAGLNLVEIASVGVPALAVTLLSMALALASAYWLGRAFGLWRRTAVLIGAGTAICGNSAIIAVAPLIDAEDDDVLLSVGTINLIGLLLMFASPLAGGLMGLSDEAFGVWAGTTIHAVPQVVTAGFAYSQSAGALATLVKLVRVTMLAPLVFLLAAVYARRHTTRATVRYARLVPPFVWGFLAVAALNTLGLIPALDFRPAGLLGMDTAVRVALADVLTSAGNLALTLAMAAMGLEVNLRFLARVGGKALLTGAASCLVLCAASLALIRLLL